LGGSISFQRQHANVGAFLFMTLEMLSGCKVNLVLNILGKRPDGFHKLETLMQPVPLHDRLTLRQAGKGITLRCDHPDLAVDASNLVFRAAAAFFEATGLEAAVEIQLEKHIPLAAGLGGGSGNAAATLVGLNQLFDCPLAVPGLHEVAARLGSDVPFFLEPGPALATGRGERIARLEPFQALEGAHILLIHPGFGISTAWAYEKLAQFPQALNGTAGRANQVAELLRSGDLAPAGRQFYNSLEAPALHKYPLLVLFREFLLEKGAEAALMSGSGSTVFGLTRSQAAANALVEQFKSKFGPGYWVAALPL
jgi:4-diphosphocytidyl-2-C-methyl-D-erythritol kinase